MPPHSFLGRGRPWLTSARLPKRVAGFAWGAVACGQHIRCRCRLGLLLFISSRASHHASSCPRTSHCICLRRLRGLSRPVAILEGACISTSFKRSVNHKEAPCGRHVHIMPARWPTFRLHTFVEQGCRDIYHAGGGLARMALPVLVSGTCALRQVLVAACRSLRLSLRMVLRALWGLCLHVSAGADATPLFVAMRSCVGLRFHL